MTTSFYIFSKMLSILRFFDKVENKDLTMTCGNCSFATMLCEAKIVPTAPWIEDQLSLPKCILASGPCFVPSTKIMRTAS